MAYFLKIVTLALLSILYAGSAKLLGANKKSDMKQNTVS